MKTPVLFFLLGIFSAGFRPLGTVFGTSLTAFVNTEAVQRTAHDVVTHTGKVANTTAFNQNDGVFLKVVTLTTDISGDFLIKLNI